LVYTTNGELFLALKTPTLAIGDIAIFQLINHAIIIATNLEFTTLASPEYHT
jgi:hypothetical protein